jgi:hypothetical protein
VIDVPDSTSDLASGTSFVRARRGRVTIEVAPVAVQTVDAARVLGISEDTLLTIPFSVLPYRRLGTHRWYLVRLLSQLAERLMAEQIAHGVPRGRESFLVRITSPEPTTAP